MHKTWGILSPSERRKAIWILPLLMLMAIVETLGVISIMPFLTVLGRPAVIEENVLLRSGYTALGFQSHRDFLIALGLASIAAVIGAALFKTVTLHMVNRFVHMLRHSISARLLSRYLHQPYEFFLTHNPSQLGRNALSEVDQLLSGLIQPLSQVLAQGTIVAAMATLVLWYDPFIAIAIVATIGTLYGAIYALVRKRLALIGRERQRANGHRFQSCNEVLGGIKDVKVTHSASFYQKKFDRASRELSRHTATSETLAQTPLYLVEAVGYTGLILIAIALMLRSDDIARVLPALGLYGFAAYRMLPAAQIMYRGLAKLKFSSAALDTIHNDLTLAVHRGPAPDSEALIPKREIRLDGVSYAYPSTPGKPVLDQFDLIVPVGASVGIVGRTGAGKSTLMDILLGLLTPQSGTFCVDGIPITTGNAHNWQRSIGYVPQHIYLADTSVLENIAFGVTSEHINRDAVERAARVAQIHDFIIAELPEGYDTRVGDRGVRLSGGQRQRLGIARALYCDPPVLFMDEATSALDPETEHVLNEAIRDLSGKKTIVVISHKESTLRFCDRFVTIER